jgi:predicted amidophosphoribosyltransferase
VICHDAVGSNAGLAIMPCPSGKRFENCKKKHEFCLGCIKDWAKSNDTCPLCREKFERNAIIHQVCTEKEHAVSILRP